MLTLTDFVPLSHLVTVMAVLLIFLTDSRGKEIPVALEPFVGFILMQITWLYSALSPFLLLSSLAYDKVDVAGGPFGQFACPSASQPARMSASKKSVIHSAIYSLSQSVKSSQSSQVKSVKSVTQSLSHSVTQSLSHSVTQSLSQYLLVSSKTSKTNKCTSKCSKCFPVLNFGTKLICASLCPQMVLVNCA